MRNHYVVYTSWNDGGDTPGTNIIAVTHTKEDAKIIFDQCVKDEKIRAEDLGYTIYTDSPTFFGAVDEEGSGYTCVYLDEVIEYA